MRDPFGRSEEADFPSLRCESPFSGGKLRGEIRLALVGMRGYKTGPFFVRSSLEISLLCPLRYSIPHFYFHSYFHEGVGHVPIFLSCVGVRASGAGFCGHRPGVRMFDDARIHADTRVAEIESGIGTEFRSVHFDIRREAGGRHSDLLRSTVGCERSASIQQDLRNRLRCVLKSLTWRLRGGDDVPETIQASRMSDAGGVADGKCDGLHSIS